MDKLEDNIFVTATNMPVTTTISAYCLRF